MQALLVGRVPARVDYDDWGRPTAYQSLNISGGYRTILPEITYAGHQYDDVLGLFYAKARMYDADNRRFAAVDPVKGSIANPLTLVQYLYVIDNPINYVDLDGRRVDIGGGGGGYTPLETNKPTSDKLLQMFVTTDSVRFRASPGLSGPILGLLYTGDSVIDLIETKFADNYNWRKVQFNGQIGWVADKYLSYEDSNAANSFNSSNNKSDNSVGGILTPVGSGSQTPETSGIESDGLFAELMDEFHPGFSGASTDYVAAVYLLDSNGAFGMGHAAMGLVQADGTITVYSMFADSALFAQIIIGENVPGQYGSASIRFNEFIEMMSENLSIALQTEDDKKSGQTEIVTEHYTDMVWITLDHDEGVKMRNHAESLYSNTPDYNLYANNCNYVAQQVLDSVGLAFTETSGDASDERQLFSYLVSLGVTPSQYSAAVLWLMSQINKNSADVSIAAELYFNEFICHLDLNSDVSKLIDNAFLLALFAKTLIGDIQSDTIPNLAYMLNSTNLMTMRPNQIRKIKLQ